VRHGASSWTRQAATNTYLAERNANPKPLVGPSLPMLFSQSSVAALFHLVEPAC
jgi:hypothetical protein